MLNLHHLQIFLAVAQLESYSRAAERLGISQPAVSMQIRKLEEAVGVPLVVTKGRLVSLTAAGETLAGYAERLVRLDREARQAMADLRDVRQGRLRVAASSTPGAYLLPGLVAKFREAFPGIGISLELGNTRAACRLVAQDLADLAVVGETAPEGLEVQIKPLWDDRLCVVVAPGHRWAGGAAITAADLAAEPLILREEGSNTRAVLNRRLAERGLAPKVALELGSTEAVKEAVASGLGPAVLSGLAVRWEVNAGRLIRVDVADLDLRRKLHLVLPGNGPASPAAAAFAERLCNGSLCP